MLLKRLVEPFDSNNFSRIQGFTRVLGELSECKISMKQLDILKTMTLETDVYYFSPIYVEHEFLCYTYICTICNVLNVLSVL